MKVTVKQLEAAVDEAERLGVLEGAPREQLRDLVKARRLAEALKLVTRLADGAKSARKGEDPNTMNNEAFDAWVRTRPWVAMRSNRLKGRVIVVLLDERRYEEARRAWPDAAVLTLAEGLELADRQPSDAALTMIVDAMRRYGGRLNGEASAN